MKKNYFKNLMQVSLLLGAAFVISSCDDVIGQEDNPVASYVQWKANTPEEVTLKIGNTYTVKATAVSSAIIVYESENPKIAKVDPVTGEITAVAVGETNINAVISGASSAGKSVFTPEKISIKVIVKDGKAKLTRVKDEVIEFTANVDSVIDLSKLFTAYPKIGTGDNESAIEFEAFTYDYNVGTKKYEYNPYTGNKTTLGLLTSAAKKFEVGEELKNTDIAKSGISDTLYIVGTITAAPGTTNEYDYTKVVEATKDTVKIIINKSIAYMNEKNERTILTADKYTNISKVLSDAKFNGTIKAGTYFVDANIGSWVGTPKISGDVTFILQNNTNSGLTSIDDATENSTLNFFRQANVKDGNGDDLAVGSIDFYNGSAGNAITNFKAINIYGGSIGAYGRGANKAAIINVGNINVYNDARLYAYGYSSSSNYASGIKLRNGGKLTVAGGMVYAYTNLNDIDNGFAVIGDVEVSKGVFTAENPAYRAVKGNLTAGGKILIKESNDNSTWTALENATSAAKYIQAQDKSDTWK